LQNLIDLKSFSQGVLAVACILSLGTSPNTYAADHRDGPKIRTMPQADITDVYAFREGDQNNLESENTKLVLVLNSNGLVPAGQASSFATDVTYQIKVGRGSKSANADKVFTFKFGDPGNDGKQKITLNGQDAGVTTIGSTPDIYNLDLEGNKVSLFAGERDDPFFLDFRVLAEGLATGKETPLDSFGKSNVSSIVISVPMAYFQSDQKETSFSVWGTTTR
jgi:hypothetical protein